MIKHGVALVRASNSPNGCACAYQRPGRTLEEFYVVIFRGKILTPRFMSYAAAFEHSEKLRAETCADVA
jgi:hypothetical protein